MVRLRNAVMAVALGTGEMGCALLAHHMSPTTRSGTAMSAMTFPRPRMGQETR